MDHTSPGTSPGRWSKTKILGGARFRGKQVGGKTAAKRLEDALVLAVHDVMLYILISLYRFILNLGERGGSVSSGLYD